MTLYIKAKVVYLDFEGGFWGLIDQKDGQQYYPLNFPQQLKIKNKIISCGIEIMDNVNMVMWGEPVKLTSFET